MACKMPGYILSCIKYQQKANQNKKYIQHSKLTKHEINISMYMHQPPIKSENCLILCSFFLRSQIYIFKGYRFIYIHVSNYW